MATSISATFSELRSNLEITNLQGETVSVRQKAVRDVLEAGITVEDTFLTGSYSRSTMIAPLKDADVDIFAVLHPNYFHHYNGQNGGQAGLLDFTKRTLKKTYTRTPDISRNGQAVTIRFSDFVVDVVPGFRRQGGGYLIPNSVNSNWISTDPKKHVELVSASNQAHENNFVPLIKMIKCWNREHGSHFRSFHLEVLALAILQNVRISSFQSGVRFYFDKARELVRRKNPDPAGYGDDVGSYINTPEKVADAANRFQKAYERALLAEEWEARLNISQAVDSWRTLFGDMCPAYG